MDENKDIKKWSDEEVIELLTPDIQKAEATQGLYAADRERYDKLFRQQKYGNERAGFSQAVAPTIYSNHKWTMANLMDIFNEDFFNLKGDDDERTTKLQKLIYYQMFRKQDGFRKFFDFLFTASIDKYTVMKVHHKEDFDLISDTYASLTEDEMLKMSQDPNQMSTKYDTETDEFGVTTYKNVKVVHKDIKYAGPFMDKIPNWEFFYSADCKITDWGAIEGRLVYHKYKKTLDEVRKREKAGVYRKGTFAKLKDKLNTESPDPIDKIQVLFNADSVATMDTQEPSFEDDNILSREVEIKECYFRLDIDNDGLLEPVIIDICDDVVCRLIENDYKRPCFRIGHLSPEPHKVAGRAMPDILETDQKIQTNLIRLMQDSAAIDCYKNPVTNDHQMFTMLQDRKPFAVIKGDPTRLGEVKTSPPSTFILQALEYMKAGVEEVTGMTRYNQGQDAASLNKTATGISAIFNASEKPMRLVARIIGNGAILGIIRDFIFINQKWPPQTDIKILGTDVTVNPDDMTGEHDVEIDIGVSASEKQAVAGQLDQLLQFSTQAGLGMGIMNPIHVTKIIKKKYRILGQKIDEMMNTEQEIQTQMDEKKKNPPKPDLREQIQFDKIYPLLARSEQAQILQMLGITPDPNPQAAGLPDPNKVIDLQKQREQAQGKMAQQAQAHAQSKEQMMAQMAMASQKHEQDKAKTVMGMVAKAHAARTQKEAQNDKGTGATRTA